MEIVKVKKNINLIKNFFLENKSKYFTYYDNRDFNIIKNHISTILLLNNNKYIGYGHIDKDKNNIFWFAIFISEMNQGKGYSKIICDYLFNICKKKNIEKLHLSVNNENIKALNLYFKKKFKVIKYENNNYIMCKNINYENILSLPISIGEAIDKLSILDIKKQKIKDDRLKFVIKEYNILYNELYNFIKQNKFYYDILIDINKNIWEMQDDFRNSDDNNKTKLCLKIIEENDRRFRVKKKINNLCKSELKEQKGYKPSKAFILTHIGLGDNITSIGAVRYLSTKYDEVYVVCKNNNIKNIKQIYSDDINIKIIGVDNDKNISPNLGCNYNYFKKITEGMELYLCGCHLFTKKPQLYNELPFNFYKDLDLSNNIFWDYFYIHKPIESKILYKNIKNYKYIFIHNNSSTGDVFTIDNALKLIRNNTNININDYLIINPCKNVYDKKHKFYELANKFIFKDICSYIDTIINSEIIILTDSSFFCLSIQLPIISNYCYYISRNNINYDYLYNEKNNFNNNNNNNLKKKFILLK